MATGLSRGNTPARVSIVEDEVLMRSMLERTLGEHEDLRVAHSVPGVQEARLLITPRSTDVAVIDVNLPDGNGVALGLLLQRADPSLGIMLLSSQDVMGLFTSVAHETTRPWSYLSKRSTFTRDVLVNAVIATAHGESVIDPYLTQRSTPRAGTAVATLTPAQFQVLRLVSEGLSNETIAERLEISARSVESHLRATYKRLGLQEDAQNRRVAAVIAFLSQTGRMWNR